VNTDPIDRLLDQPAFAAERPGRDFILAVNACLEALRSRFPRYDAFLRRTHSPHVTPLSTLAQVHALPAVLLTALKSYQFPLPADMDVTVRLTSSGTTGQPSVIPQDAVSWRRRVQAMQASYRALDLFPGKVQALAFLMDPSTTRMAGSLVIDAVLRLTPEVESVTYLARMSPTGPDFPLLAAVTALLEAVRQGPVLMVGYPALMSAMIQGLQRSGKTSFPLPEGSRFLTGGGWKSFLPGVTLDQEAFRLQVAEFFHAPPQAIRDMYGLSECPAVFVQCDHGRYHAPAWAWAQAVDPEDGNEVPLDEVGLLQLTVPLTTSYPLLKILTTDKVSIHQGCGCGRGAVSLRPRGRVAVARFETCAMKMSRAVPSTPRTA
jgi:phenylacetate-coenzyme A ligase PaaK-like adenylate-forming protein